MSDKSTEDQVSETAANVPAEIIAPHRDGKPIRPPAGIGVYRFAVVSALRAGQLLRGCIPRVDDGGAHRATVLAQLEVAGGKVIDVPQSTGR
jgi:hypothetical protein